MAPSPPATTVPTAASPSPAKTTRAWQPEDISLGFGARRWNKRGLFIKRSVLALSLAAVIAGLGARVGAQGQLVKSQVESSITVARTSAAAARTSLASGQYGAAKQQFGVARESLKRANQTLAEHGQLGSRLGAAVGQRGTIALGSSLLTSGELLAGSGEQLAGDLENVTTGLAAKGGDPLRAGEVVIGELPTLKTHLADARHRLELLEAVVNESQRSGVRGELGEATKQLDQSLPALTAGLDHAVQAADAVPTLLGNERFKQYVVLFQNPAELRATGGFIGTYGRITVDRGAVTQLLVESIYNPANQANSAVTEKAPAPYSRFYGEGQNPIWAMQDANWSPDFATTAKKFQEFYEKGGGPTTDGVIGLTVNPIVETLKVVGPVELPEYGYTLSAENFQQLIQADQQERSVTNDADPKKILRDFTPKLLAKVGTAPPEKRAAIFKVFRDAVSQRDLMIYFDDNRLQYLAAQAGSTGLLAKGPASLSIVDSNIAGLKSSTDVATKATENVVIERDGRRSVELVITRRHTAATSLAGNSNFTRIFVPKGAELVGSDGFAPVAPVSTEEEDGFTVIGGWTDLAPGEERTVTARYKLPRKLDLKEGRLPLHYTKQGGTGITLIRNVTLPSGYRWEGGAGTIDGQTLRLAETARTDLHHVLRFRSRT